MALYNPLSADKGWRKLLLSEQSGETGHKHNQSLSLQPKKGDHPRYFELHIPL